MLNPGQLTRCPTPRDDNPVGELNSSLRKHAHVICCNTVRLLVPGHFYVYAVSKFLLRENDISVVLL